MTKSGFFRGLRSLYGMVSTWSKRSLRLYGNLWDVWKPLGWLRSLGPLPCDPFDHCDHLRENTKNLLSNRLTWVKSVPLQKLLSIVYCLGSIHNLSRGWAMMISLFFLSFYGSPPLIISGFFLLTPLKICWFIKGKYHSPPLFPQQISTTCQTDPQPNQSLVTGILSFISN